MLIWCKLIRITESCLCFWQSPFKVTKLKCKHNSRQPNKGQGCFAKSKRLNKMKQTFKLKN